MDAKLSEEGPQKMDLATFWHGGIGRLQGSESKLCKRHAKPRKSARQNVRPDPGFALSTFSFDLNT